MLLCSGVPCTMYHVPPGGGAREREPLQSASPGGQHSRARPVQFCKDSLNWNTSASRALPSDIPSFSGKHRPLLQSQKQDCPEPPSQSQLPQGHNFLKVSWILSRAVKLYRVDRRYQEEEWVTVYQGNKNQVRIGKIGDPFIFRTLIIKLSNFQTFLIE